MSRFIELTMVYEDGSQDYVILNIDEISLIVPCSNWIMTRKIDRTFELTDESMEKLLSVMKSYGYKLGDEYVPPEN